MKNFLKNLSVYLTVVMCLVSCVSFAVPGFAAENEVVVPDITETLVSPGYFSADLEEMTDGEYSGNVYYSVWESLPAGQYYVSGVLLVSGGSADAFQVVFGELDASTIGLSSFDVVFDLADGHAVVVQSHDVEPVLYRVVEEPQPEGLYYEAYDLYRELIFDPDFEITPPQEWCLAILATITTLFIIVIPFIVVWFVLISLGRWR